MASTTQQHINLLADSGALIADIREAIVSAAADAHSQYPQYAGHWDGGEWSLGTITRRVRTKMGAAFERGDIVLFRAAHADSCADFTAYSIRNGIDTAIDAEWVEALVYAYRHREGLVNFA